MRVPGWPPIGLSRQWLGYQKLSRRALQYIRAYAYMYRFVYVLVLYYSIMTERLSPAAGQIDN